MWGPALTAWLYSGELGAWGVLMTSRTGSRMPAGATAVQSRERWVRLPRDLVSADARVDRSRTHLTALDWAVRRALAHWRRFRILPAWEVRPRGQRAVGARRHPRKPPPAGPFASHANRCPCCVESRTQLDWALSSFMAARRSASRFRLRR